MSVTTKEIAELCGVSRGSVDRALNNRPGINPETRKKILETAEKLGYKPNFIAKSLVTGKTKTIGVVVFDVNSWFFGQLVHAIETRARQLGYFVYLTVTDKNPEIEKQCIQYLCDRKVDGLILFAINKGRSFESSLLSYGIPVLTMVNKVGTSFDYIGINDKNAIFDAVSFINQKGHSNIAYVTTPIPSEKNYNFYAVEQRLAGFISACEQLGIPQCKENIICEKDYAKTILERLQYKDRPTAILCSNDFYALELMKVLKAKGYKIPKDISIMGFDDIDALRYIEPGLTTISYPIERLGTQGTEMLIATIENAENQNNITVFKKELLEYKLIERESVYGKL